MSRDKVVDLSARRGARLGSSSASLVAGEACVVTRIDSHHKEITCASDFFEALASFSRGSIDPDRPFTGQDHTFFGARGSHVVSDLRLRDLCDAMAKGIALCFGIENPEIYARAMDGTLSYNDLYGLDLNKIDPVAAIQNFACVVEEMQGIFPNVPKLTPRDDDSLEGEFDDFE